MEAVRGKHVILFIPPIPSLPLLEGAPPLWSLRGKGDPLTATNITAPRVLDGKLEPQLRATLVLLVSPPPHRKPTSH